MQGLTTLEVLALHCCFQFKDAFECHMANSDSDMVRVAIASAAGYKPSEELRQTGQFNRFQCINTTGGAMTDARARAVQLPTWLGEARSNGLGIF